MKHTSRHVHFHCHKPNFLCNKSDSDSHIEVKLCFILIATWFSSMISLILQLMSITGVVDICILTYTGKYCCVPLTVLFTPSIHMSLRSVDEFIARNTCNIQLRPVPSEIVSSHTVVGLFNFWTKHNCEKRKVCTNPL